MSGEYNIFSRIRDILDGNADAERQRKAGMFGLGFWIVMILKMFL